MRALVLPLALLALSLLGCNNDKANFQQPEAGGPASETSPWPTGDLYANTDAKFDGRSCGEAEFKIARTIPDMLILLDRSNSMGEGKPPLWDTIRTVIYDVTAAMDQAIWFGLFAFPNSLDPGPCFLMFGQCGSPAGPVVGVAAATGAAIKTALTPMGVCGGTPTAPTLAAAKLYLQTKLAANNHPKYILLATDGGPNCNTALNPKSCTCVIPCSEETDGTNCLDDVATLKALDDLCAAGIKTYVVGLGGAQTFTTVLQQMAQHGCTKQPYAPTDPAAIKKAFADISGAVATCTYDVECSKIQDTGLVNFYFDGKVVPRTTSHAGGWDWTTTCKGQTGTGVVEFFGPECTAIKGGTVKAIAAKFGCKTEID